MGNYMLETVHGIRLLGPRAQMIRLATVLFPTCSFDGRNVSIREFGCVATIVPE